MKRAQSRSYFNHYTSDRMVNIMIYSLRAVILLLIVAMSISIYFNFLIGAIGPILIISLLNIYDINVERIYYIDEIRSQKTIIKLLKNNAMTFVGKIYEKSECILHYEYPGGLMLINSNLKVIRVFDSVEMLADIPIVGVIKNKRFINRHFELLNLIRDTSTPQFQSQHYALNLRNQMVGNVSKYDKIPTGEGVVYVHGILNEGVDREDVQAWNALDCRYATTAEVESASIEL